MSSMVASVITLSSPFQGLAAHPSVLRVAQAVRSRILDRHGKNVLPSCYTAGCTCRFLESLEDELPGTVSQIAVFTKSDGIVDWQVCATGNPDMDFEVAGTHIGMVFNPIVLDIVAHRLARKRPPQYALLSDN